MSQGHLLLASHGPLRVLHTGLSGEGGPLGHSGDVSRRGYATCSRRWGGRVMAVPRHPVSCPHSQNNNKAHV